MMDPRIISAVAFLLIGAAIISFVARVWLTHPVNRVFLVGRFVTEDGLRLMLRNLSTVFALGLFALAAGAAKIAYADRWQNGPSNTPHPADFFGILEAIFAVWAAGCVCIVVARLCRKG